MVKQYNLDATNDKNQVSKKTIEFINVRLDTIGKLLSVIQDKVKDFKMSKDFSGLPIELQLSLETLKETNQQIIASTTELNLAEWIESKLEKDSEKFTLLPVSLGIQDNNISSSIIKYNEIVKNRNQTAIDAGPENPILKELESQIESSKIALLRSLKNVSKSIQLKLNDLKKEQQKVLSKVQSFPENERGYIDIAREQEIISGLYQYLLKKKEETDISLAVTVPNAKIIDSAYSSKIPVSPKKSIIYLVALLLGVIIPLHMYLCHESTRHKSS